MHHWGQKKNASGKHDCSRIALLVKANRWRRQRGEGLSERPSAKLLIPFYFVSVHVFVFLSFVALWTPVELHISSCFT